MTEIKIHSYKGLKAFYTKKGRLWYVEEDGKVHQFKSVEEMVEAFPDLLKVEPIQHTVERRKLAKPPVQLESKDDNEEVLTKTTECYYCQGTGEVIVGLPCHNCGGKGFVVVTAKGL